RAANDPCAARSRDSDRPALARLVQLLRKKHRRRMVSFALPGWVGRRIFRLTLGAFALGLRPGLLAGEGPSKAIFQALDEDGGAKGPARAFAGTDRLQCGLVQPFGQ